MLATETKVRISERHDVTRRATAESLVALLTHYYIHLGMDEAHAYRSALVDFEIDYPEEVAAFRAAAS